MTVDVTALWKRTADVACYGTTCVEGAVAKRETNWQNDQRHGRRTMAAEDIEALRSSTDEVNEFEGRDCGWRCVYAALIVRMAMEWR